MSRLTWDCRSASPPFRLRGSHPLWPAFPDGSPTENWSLIAVPLPRQSFLWRFGLLRFRSPLLAESHLLSFPRGTEMFHFPRFAPLHLWIQCRVRRHYPPWVSPFGHRRIKAWLAAPRRFSQLPTSFFASCRLGIHRVPFVAWSSLFLPPSISSSRRPGSSAAPWLTGNPRRTDTSLIAYLRICSFQRPCSVSQNQTASPHDCETAFDLVLLPAVAGGRSSLERR